MDAAKLGLVSTALDLPGQIPDYLNNRKLDNNFKTAPLFSLDHVSKSFGINPKNIKHGQSRLWEKLFKVPSNHIDINQGDISIEGMRNLAKLKDGKARSVALKTLRMATSAAPGIYAVSKGGDIDIDDASFLGLIAGAFGGRLGSTLYENHLDSNANKRITKYLGKFKKHIPAELYQKIRKHSISSKSRLGQVLSLSAGIASPLILAKMLNKD